MGAIPSSLFLGDVPIRTFGAMHALLRHIPEVHASAPPGAFADIEAAPSGAVAAEGAE